jgi:hypothetical protein
MPRGTRASWYHDHALPSWHFSIGGGRNRGIYNEVVWDLETEAAQTSMDCRPVQRPAHLSRGCERSYNAYRVVIRCCAGICICGQVTCQTPFFFLLIRISSLSLCAGQTSSAFRVNSSRHGLLMVGMLAGDWVAVSLRSAWNCICGLNTLLN